jgi:hypothetical protein
MHVSPVSTHDVEFTATRHFLPVRSILVPLSSLLVPAIYSHVVGPAVSSSFTMHHSFTLSGHHYPLLPFSFSFSPLLSPRSRPCSPLGFIGPASPTKLPTAEPGARAATGGRAPHAEVRRRGRTTERRARAVDDGEVTRGSHAGDAGVWRRRRLQVFF